MVIAETILVADNNSSVLREGICRSELLQNKSLACRYNYRKKKNGESEIEKSGKLFQSTQENKKTKWRNRSVTVLVVTCGV